jgi:hypothetical protein
MRLKMITGSVTLGGAIAAGGLSAYCAIHCLINKKAY